MGVVGGSTSGPSLITLYPGSLPPLKESEEEREKRLPITCILLACAAATVCALRLSGVNKLTYH